MGKKQHSKDRLFITTKEWKEEWGGKKSGDKTKFARLPFYCCFISLLPFKDPYCTKDGAIFDILNIVPFIKKYGVNPIDGKKLALRDLVKLTFYKNNEDQFHCPVLFRQFTENSHIVAIATTGNVYSYEAIAELNIKANNWKDLLTDQLFKKSDIITIQDPSNLDRFNVVNFYHVQNNLRISTGDSNTSESTKNLKNVNQETKSILNELDSSYKGGQMSLQEKNSEDTIEDEIYRKDSIYSTGKVSQSFTSTVATPVTHQTALSIDKDLVRYERVNKKGYVQLVTNMGSLNIELYCELVPKTCENFLLLCKRNYYNNSKFHRLIPSSILQGGDPTGNGKGGESAWGAPFKDEFHKSLKHSERGIISMANRGQDTNKSQFFICLKPNEKFDNKYAVFGKLVGGFDTLDNIECVPVDDSNRPEKDITIISTKVFVDPFEEVDRLLREEYAKRTANSIDTSSKNKTYKRTSKFTDSTVGIYMQNKTTSKSKKPKFGDFNKW